MTVKLEVTEKSALSDFLDYRAQWQQHKMPFLWHCIPSFTAPRF